MTGLSGGCLWIGAGRGVVAVHASAVSLLLLTASGCGGGSTRTGEPVAMPADRAQWFAAGPVEARVHPATRFVLEGERAFLQLGVELLDALGDPVKGVGILRCQLLDDPEEAAYSGLRGGQASGTAPAPRGVRLYGWEARLATREEQEASWSPVLRCYTLELALRDFGVASRPSRVRVEFEPASPQDPPLTAEAAMQTLPQAP